MVVHGELDDVKHTYEATMRDRADIEREELARLEGKGGAYDTVTPALDPDEALAQLAGGVEGSVDPDSYPIGTAFYYGTDQVGIRLPGAEGLSVRVDR